MTKQELREKIIEILEEAMKPIEYGGDSEHAPELHYPTEEDLADALIAAGIGDVSELETKYKQEKNLRELAEAFHNEKCAEYELLNYQFEKMKHRAEVAERALSNACRNIIADEKDSIEIEPRDEVLYKAYLKQAEKELQEERKDD